MKKECTRTKILDAAAELVHRQGFNHTGLQEILEATGVPKGSFYFYFKSKEDLGLALVDHYREQIQARARLYFDDHARPPLERLRTFFQAALEHQEAGGCQKGCPIGNLCQEMSDLSPLFREKLEEVLMGTAMGITYLLYQAKEAGDLPAYLDPEDTARFIKSSWQGARKKRRTEARATRDAARQYLASRPLRDAAAFRAFGRAEVKAGRDVRIALGLLILGPAIGMVGAMRIDARQR